MRIVYKEPHMNFIGDLKTKHAEIFQNGYLKSSHFDQSYQFPDIEFSSFSINEVFGPTNKVKSETGHKVEKEKIVLESDHTSSSQPKELQTEAESKSSDQTDSVKPIINAVLSGSFNSPLKTNQGDKKIQIVTPFPPGKEGGKSSPSETKKDRMNPASKANHQSKSVTVVKPSPNETTSLIQEYNRRKYPLKIFYSDFDKILNYCLEPVPLDIHSPYRNVSRLSFRLLKMIEQKRSKALRKEQCLKKVFNYALKITQLNYVNLKFNKPTHVSDHMKLDFRNTLFGKSNPRSDVSFEPTPTSASKPKKSLLSNFNFNKTFFQALKSSSVFFTDFTNSISSLKENIPRIVNMELQRLLIKIEKFLSKEKSEDDKLLKLDEFFNLRNKFDKKLGVKYPWTVKDYQNSVVLAYQEMDNATQDFGYLGINSL